MDVSEAERVWTTRYGIPKFYKRDKKIGYQGGILSKDGNNQRIKKQDKHTNKEDEYDHILQYYNNQDEDQPEE